MSSDCVAVDGGHRSVCISVVFPPSTQFTFLLGWRNEGLKAENKRVSEEIGRWPVATKEQKRRKNGPAEKAQRFAADSPNLCGARSPLHRLTAARGVRPKRSRHSAPSRQMAKHCGRTQTLRPLWVPHLACWAQFGRSLAAAALIGLRLRGRLAQNKRRPQV